MKGWAPSKDGGTLSKVPQLGTKKTPANHRHYRHDRHTDKEAAYPSRSLKVYVPEYTPSRATVSRFAVSDGYRTATNAGLSPSFTLVPAWTCRFQATKLPELYFRAVLADGETDTRFGWVREG